MSDKTAEELGFKLEVVSSEGKLQDIMNAEHQDR